MITIPVALIFIAFALPAWFWFMEWRSRREVEKDFHHLRVAWDSAIELQERTEEQNRKMRKRIAQLEGRTLQ